jgi:hypothetical protein
VSWVLRHQQQASVHRLLREYESLGENPPKQFVVDETQRMGIRPSPAACFGGGAAVDQAAQTLMDGSSVDAPVDSRRQELMAERQRLTATNPPTATTVAARRSLPWFD